VEIIMTHRQVLDWAGRLAEHGGELIERSSGAAPAALRRYLRTSRALFQAWTARLDAPATPPPLLEPILRVEPHGRRFTIHAAYVPDDEPNELVVGSTAQWRDHALPTLQTIATFGVFVRVAGVLLHAIGDRLDIPQARDTALRSLRAYERTVLAGMASVTRRGDAPKPDLQSLDRLGSACDRLSDLLCGSLASLVNCERFVVDPARATDFAGTYGRFPGLLRVPLRSVAGAVPHGSMTRGDLAHQMVDAMHQCFPAASRFLGSPTDEMRDLEEMFRPRVLPMPDASPRVPAPSSLPGTPSLAFPTLSFVAMLQKAR
jgi:hypothetical protein